MGTILDTIPIHEEPKPETLLVPLKSGHRVTLSILDTTMRRKKRVKKPTVILIPLQGSKVVDLLVSIPGYGSEIVQPRRVKAIELYRAGLTMKAARILANNLQLLFK